MKITKEKVIKKIIKISEETLATILLFILIATPLVNIVGGIMVLSNKGDNDSDGVTLVGHIQIWAFIVQLILFFIYI